MDKKDKNCILNEFKQIPGVGDKISEDMYNMGLRGKDDLKNRSPELLYAKLCKLQKTKVDRCMLYVFRTAVYFVSNDVHEPELLKWWNHKDKKTGENNG